jgi:hypothetical protein
MVRTIPRESITCPVGMGLRCRNSVCGHRIRASSATFGVSARRSHFPLISTPIYRGAADAPELPQTVFNDFSPRTPQTPSGVDRLFSSQRLGSYQPKPTAWVGHTPISRPDQRPFSYLGLPFWCPPPRSRLPVYSSRRSLLVFCFSAALPTPTRVAPLC